MNESFAGCELSAANVGDPISDSVASSPHVVSRCLFMILSPSDFQLSSDGRSIQTARPFVGVALGLIALFAVDLLELAYELFALALDQIPVVVRELSPTLLRLAL